MEKQEKTKETKISKQIKSPPKKKPILLDAKEVRRRPLR